MTDKTVGEIGDESTIDDFQGIDLDINSLINKFVQPIEKYRSRSFPNIFDKLDQNVSSSEKIQESRIHTFYRILGLPTITPTGKLYNPGFNPLRSSSDINKYEQINSEIPHDVKLCIYKRESYSLNKSSIFSKASSDASVFGLALATPKGQRQFMSMNQDIDSLSNIDPQQKQIPERKIFITNNYKKKDGSEISETFNNVTHILRPFITDPVISTNVSPKAGSSTVMIAAPFLTIEDTEYERNKYVKRSGLEFILRLRLKQQNILEQAGYVIDNINLSSFSSDIKNESEIAAVLTNSGVSKSDINQAMKGSGLLELYTVNDLIKTYKGLIDLYVKNTGIIEQIHKKIIWIPLPNDGGPEKGNEISTNFIIPKKILDSWEIERRISQLEVKSSIAKTQVNIGDELSFNDFTISEFYNISNDFSDSLKDVKNERNQLEAQASNALRTIEYISGEISGLGLIDIIAIYMALWSVDVSVLLDLIDDDGISRLSKIKELQTQSVKNRVNKIGSSSGIESYRVLEQRIISILAYGDRLYQQRLGSPVDQEGGDIPRNSTNIF